MSRARVGDDIGADYAKYLRGYEKLGWEPHLLDVFGEKYCNDWNARRALNRINEGRYSPPIWIRRMRDLTTRRERIRLSRIDTTLGYLHTAVEAGTVREDQGGNEDCGVTAPIITGPASRTCAGRLEIPRDFDEESAA